MKTLSLFAQDIARHAIIHGEVSMILSGPTPTASSLDLRFSIGEDLDAGGITLLRETFQGGTYRLKELSEKTATGAYGDEDPSPVVVAIFEVAKGCERPQVRQAFVQEVEFLLPGTFTTVPQELLEDAVQEVRF